jgi:hypothetical protein
MSPWLCVFSMCTTTAYLFMALALHGRERPKWDFGATLLSVAIITTIYWYGWFYTPLVEALSR